MFTHSILQLVEIEPFSKRCIMANLKNMTCKWHQNGYKYLSFLRHRWVAAVSDLQPNPDPFHLQRPVQLKRVPLGLSRWACRVHTFGPCCTCRAATFRESAALEIIFAVENCSWDKVYWIYLTFSKEKKIIKTTKLFKQWMLTCSKLLNWSNVAQAFSEKICFVLKKIYLKNQHNIYSEIKEGWLKSLLFHPFSLKLFHRPAPPSAARSPSPETAAAWGTTSLSGLWSALNAAQATFWRDRAPLNVWQSLTLWPSGTAPYPAASVRKVA